MALPVDVDDDVAGSPNYDEPTHAAHHNTLHEFFNQAGEQTDAVASSVGAIAIGDFANAATGTQAIAIGKGVSSTSAPSATGQGAVAIGASGATGVTAARASGADSIAIGSGDATVAGASATAADAVAIGRGSVNSGQVGVAIGQAAAVSATGSIAIGNIATASIGNAVAIGRNARATTGTNTVAIGGGVSTSAGPLATGAGGVAIGSNSNTGVNGARATGLNSVAIGGGDVNGAGALASATDSVAIGSTASATHATAVAIGKGSATTAANQIMLGTVAEKVQVPGFLGMSNYADLAEVSAPATPAANLVRFYAKADGKLYSKDDAGVETVVTGGGMSGYYPDAIPASPHANDDEFSDNSVGGAWTEYDHNTCVTISEDARGLSIVHASVTAIGGVYRTLPTGDFSITIQPSMSVPSAGVKEIGVVFFEDATSASGNVEGCFMQFNAAVATVRHGSWSASDFGTGDAGQLMNVIPKYLRIRKASTTYSSDFSMDGKSWTQLYSGAFISVPGTPVHVGIVMRADGGGTAHIRFWRQVTATTLDQQLLGQIV